MNKLKDVCKSFLTVSDKLDDLLGTGDHTYFDKAVKSVAEAGITLL